MVTEHETETDESNEVQVIFLASDTKRETWKQEAENRGHKTLSGFIRQSIHNEINGNGTSPNHTKHLSEIISKLEELAFAIDELDKKIVRVEREVRDDPLLKSVANEVFRILPAKDELIRYETAQGGEALAMEEDADAVLSGKLEHIANRLDQPEHRVQEAIDMLQADTHQVHEMTLNEAVPYYDHSENDGADGDILRYYKEK